MSFKKIELDQLNFNPFLRIGRDWVLLTGGTSEKFNTMTASWGQLGRLWNKNVFTAYIRPNRYTLEFVEKEECFTASFFTMDYRTELSFCGSHSGRDVDKVKETGLTPVELDGCMAFEEADMVFVLRKLYTYDMQELDPAVFAKCSKLYFDSEEAVLSESGDILRPMDEGILTKEQFTGDIGDHILRKIPGRESDEEIIVFENVGIGALDLMTALKIYDKAEDAGVGTHWE